MKKSAPQKNSSVNLSSGKKKIFWLITILLPVIVLLLLEISLRIFSYGENLELFVEGPEEYENYLMVNREVGKRYFVNEKSVPTPQIQLMLSEKPKNGYRIFILGGSSAAGFPYSNNVSFSSILRRSLSVTFPDKNIEVVNLAMSAVNSYTLLDFMTEIVNYSPDAVLIYAGHNEYYGALGVGSTQSVGNSRVLIKTYIKLQKYKTFLLVRDIVKSVWSLFSGETGENKKQAATLMSKIVSEQKISFGSELYEKGKIQFEKNMEDILEIASDKKIKIILSELVSNLKDQKPFISLNESDFSATELFQKARSYESENDFTSAKKNYKLAKDRDALRFRASEEFNSILNELSKKYSVPIVPLEKIFERNSKNTLIGSSLILEHLHPNSKGYSLIAEGFFTQLLENKMVDPDWKINGFNEIKNGGITDLDSVYASLVVKKLKGSWPFKSENYTNNFLKNYKPKTYLERISLKVMKSENYNLEAGRMDLAKLYESKNNFKKAYKEYEALIASIPHETQFYENAATALLKMKKFDSADSLLNLSMQYKESNFANKWIGQIALMKENYGKAATYLCRANGNDSQVVFNLARAYYHLGEFDKGEKCYQILKSQKQGSKYLKHLAKLRTLSKIKSVKNSSTN